MQFLYRDGLHSLQGALILFISLAILAGCGSSRGEYVYTNSPQPVPGRLNSLTVNLDTTPPVISRISGGAAEFVITVYDAARLELQQQEISRGQNAVFAELADGIYWVRVVGLDSQGNVLGYFDREVELPGETNLTIQSLLYTAPPEAVGALTAPFLAFDQFPDTVVTGTSFNVELRAYNANGTIFSEASGTVDLAVEGATFEALPTPAPLTAGVAAFSGLAFTEESAGTATLSASGNSFGDTPGPAITVTETAPVGQGYLQFTAVPEYVVSGEDFSLTVEARDEEGELMTESVEITLALAGEPVPPEEASLEGALSVDTENGVAVFEDLRFTPGGQFALAATASGFDPDESDVVTSEVPYSLLVVGELYNDILRSYALGSLREGENDIAPSNFKGQSGGDIVQLQDLVSARGGESVWLSTSDYKIKLYHDFRQVTSGIPTLTLDMGTGGIRIAYDESRDTLYALRGSGDKVIVSVFCKVTSLQNNDAEPSYELDLGEIEHSPSLAIEVDPVHDRLFVSSSTWISDTEEEYLNALLVIEAASQLPDSGGIVSHTKSLAFSGENHGISYDPKNDRLYIADYFQGLFILENASVPDASGEVIELADASYYRDVFIDTVRDSLYVLDSEGLFDSVPRVLVFFNASQITDSTPRTPDQVLTGNNTGMDAPVRLTLAR
ncbi:MAG: hypothetical protein WC423_22115 [Vulcanimicrobiota bacterium]